MMKLTKEVSVFDPFVFTEGRLYFMQFSNNNNEISFEGAFLCRSIESTKSIFVTVAQSQGTSPKEFYIDSNNYLKFINIEPMNVATGLDSETGDFILKAVIDNTYQNNDDNENSETETKQSNLKLKR